MRLLQVLPVPNVVLGFKVEERSRQMEQRRTVLIEYARDDGEWEDFEVSVRSLAYNSLMRNGGVYSDGVGNRYRLKEES